MRVVLGTLLLAFICLVYFHAKYSNTGIDLTDEAYNYLLLQSSKPGFPYWVYGNLFGPIIKILNIGLAELRMLSLLVHLLSGLFLALAVKLKLRNSSNILSYLYATFITFTPLTISGVQGRILSYNSLTFCLTCIIISSFLVSAQSKKKFISNLFLIFCALVSGVQFGVKFPQSIMVFGFIALCLIYKTSLFKLFLFSVFWIIGSLLVHNSHDVVSIFRSFSETIGEYGYDSFYGSNSFLDLYTNSIFVQFTHFFTKFDIIVVFLLLLFSKKNTVNYIFCSLLLFVYLLYRSLNSGFLQSGEEASYFMATPWFLAIMSLVVFTTFAFLRKRILFSRDQLFLMVVLFILPCLCSLGTNTSLLKQFPIYLSFSSALIVILLAKLPKSHGSFLIPLYLMTTTFCISFDSLLRNPVRITQPLPQISNIPKNSVAGKICLDDTSENVTLTINSFIKSNCQAGSNLPYIDIAGCPGTYLFLENKRNCPYYGKWLNTTSLARLEGIFTNLKNSSNRSVILHSRNKAILDNFGYFETYIEITELNSIIGLFIINS